MASMRFRPVARTAAFVAVAAGASLALAVPAGAGAASSAREAIGVRCGRGVGGPERRGVHRPAPESDRGLVHRRLLRSR